MSDTVIKVDDLGKRYRIGRARRRAQTPHGAVLNLLGSPFRYLWQTLTGPTPEETLWALRHVSFEVRRGDIIGIIGRNGSGKSTLLRILSRITEPTEGQAALCGRVGSLLEVGTGFHPELTGHENIFLNGTLLGMGRAEIARKYDSIVAFSGIGRFIDTPVKHYSSGMYVRLAFSVASHFDPEILITDEVLSVGDAAFQKKSMEKMETVARAGKTVLFVSHDLAAVARICNRGVLLADGRATYYEDVRDAIDAYLGAIHNIDGADSEDEDRVLPARLDLRGAPRWEGYSRKIFTWISAHRADGTPTVEFATGGRMLLRFGYEVEGELEAYCQLNVLDYRGTRVMQLHNTHNSAPLHLRGAGVIECVVDDVRLLAGKYILMVETGSVRPFQWLDCVPNTLHIRVALGDYLGGVGLTQAQVAFAQKSDWRVSPTPPAGT